MTDGTATTKLAIHTSLTRQGAHTSGKPINTNGISPEDNHTGVDPPVTKGSFDVFELDSITVCDPAVSGAGLKGEPVDDELLLVLGKEPRCLWVVWKQEPYGK